MNCQDIKNLLISYIDSELTEKEVALIEVHLHQCACCRKELQLFRETWNIMDRLHAPKISSDFTNRLVAKINEQKQKKPRFAFAFPQYRVNVLVPAAASLCVLIAVYLLMQNYIFKVPRVTKDYPSEQELIKDTAAGKEKNIPLVTQGDEVTIGSTEFAHNTEQSALDEDIIRYLDEYENMGLYLDYTLYDEYDVVVEDSKTEVF